mmetsp:Transcript_30393/g.26926  ORF Transcript_30393/g.26926 Transcript_30393/m.26926 type:complete len:181 (-) Transcript_30393:20-562(-)
MYNTQSNNFSHLNFAKNKLRNVQTADAKKRMNSNKYYSKEKDIEGNRTLNQNINLEYDSLSHSMILIENSQSKQANSKKKIGQKNLRTLECMRETLQKIQNRSKGNRKSHTRGIYNNESYGYPQSTNSDIKNRTFYSSTTEDRNKMRPVSAKIGKLKSKNMQKLKTKQYFMRAQANSMEH